MSRLASALGALVSGAATLAALGCCGAAALGPAAVATASAALGALAAGWTYAALYAALGLTLLGLMANLRRHRRLPPLGGALLGAAALLAAFHEAWDVTVFAGLVVAGVGMLLGAVALDGWWTRRARRAHGCPAPGARGGAT